MDAGECVLRGVVRANHTPGVRYVGSSGALIGVGEVALSFAVSTPSTTVCRSRQQEMPNAWNINGVRSYRSSS